MYQEAGGWSDKNYREVSFIYHADGYDIPGGWEKEKYYDVMYSESHDWWTQVIVFNTSKGQ